MLLTHSGMKHLFYISSFLIGIFLFSCTKQDRENTVIDQEKRIDTYISSLTDVRVVRRDGSNRIVVKEGPSGADTLAAGDSVRFYYAGYVFSGGKGDLFVTNNAEVAQENNFVTDGAAEKKKVDKKDLIPGLYSGMIGAREGETCHIVFSAKYGFDNTVVYNIPKLTPLFFEIWIEEVIKN